MYNITIHSSVQCSAHLHATQNIRGVTQSIRQQSVSIRHNLSMLTYHRYLIQHLNFGAVGWATKGHLAC